MDRNEFWQLVDEIGWGTKTTDHRKVKIHLMKHLSPEEATSMREHFWIVNGNVSSAINKHVRDIGSDSFDDLASHIVGLGKETWAHILANPSQCKIDYVESFSYCIPFTDDYKK